METPAGGGGPRPDAPGYTFHLPESFDPAAVTRPAWADYARWAVSAVVFRRFVEKDADALTFVPLAAEFVEQYVPANVRRPLFAGLLDAGVLECDGTYCPARFAPGGRGKCRGYRLGPALRGARLRLHPATHHELLRKVAAARAADRARVTEPVHVALRGWAERVEVLPAAPRGEHLLLDKLAAGEYWFKVCDQGRVHTNVTNLPRRFRQYLRLAGRELVALDIATSQPLILAVLLGGCVRRPGPGVVYVPAAAAKAIGRNCSPESLSDFLRDCRKGVVYDRLEAATGYGREVVKRRLLAVVYGNPRDMGTRVGRAVRELYPGVLDAVAALYGELGHGGLPRLMQRAESGVMIDRVAGRLTREHPAMPLLTVHDSVVVPPEAVAVARAMIEVEWAAAFGVVPRVKVSEFTAAVAVSPEPRSPARRASPAAAR